MFKRGLSLALFGVVLAAGACTKDTPAPGPTPIGPSPIPAGGASKVVSAAGGQVALAGGETVDIPAGAVDGNVTVEVSQTDADKVQAKPAQIELVSRPVVFKPHGLTFKVPVTVTLPYVSTKTDLVVMRLDDEKDTTWELVPAKFEGGKAIFQTSRFSVYIVGLRLDVNATCQELCPRLQACTTDCATGCTQARSACFPDAWGRVAACLDAATKPTADCGRVDACLAAEPCTGVVRGDAGVDGSVVPDAAPPDASTDASTDATGADGGVDAAVDSGVCGPVATFADAFTRVDATSVGGCWVTYPAQLPEPAVNANRACGDDQSVALMRVNMAPTTVEYDWGAASAAGLETNALAAFDTAGTITSGFFAGVDGGSTPQRLFIKTLSGTVLAGPMDVSLSATTTYHIAATFNPSGAISLTLTQGAAVVGSLSTNVGGGITFNRSGFVVGRSVDTALTCVDNFTIAQ